MPNLKRSSWRFSPDRRFGFRHETTYTDSHMGTLFYDLR